MPTSYWWRLRLECRWLSVVGGFELGGWDVAEDAVQPAVVVPVDPFHRRVLDVIDRLRRVRPERATLADHLGLEQADSRLGQRIIIGVTDAADRRCDTLEGESLGERNRRILPELNRWLQRRLCGATVAARRGSRPASSRPEPFGACC